MSGRKSHLFSPVLRSRSSVWAALASVTAKFCEHRSGAPLQLKAFLRIKNSPAAAHTLATDVLVSPLRRSNRRAAIRAALFRMVIDQTEQKQRFHREQLEPRRRGRLRHSAAAGKRAGSKQAAGGPGRRRRSTTAHRTEGSLIQALNKLIYKRAFNEHCAEQCAEQCHTAEILDLSELEATLEDLSGRLRGEEHSGKTVAKLIVFFHRNHHLNF